MGSGSNGVVNMLCLCHPASRGQKMAVVTPGLGIEVISRHHATYHTGSLSVRDLLTQLSGTTEGSAIIDFVIEQVGGA
mgnify:FL=1